MTYSAVDQSRALGAPVVLLRFNYGPGGSLRYLYTNYSDVIRFESQDYQPIPLDVDAPKAMALSGRYEYTIKLPLDSEVAQLFRFYPPPDPVTVVVFYGHVSDEDNEFIAIYTGEVKSAQPGSGLEAEITCEWAGSKLRRPGNFRRWQYTCNKVLYSTDEQGCKADPVAATRTSQVQQKQEYAIRLETGWNDGLDLENFIGGSVSWVSSLGTEYRTVIDIIGDDTLILSNVLRGLNVGDSVSVRLGCSRTYEACRFVHNNIANFGGQPWIPTENPINRDIFT